MKPHEALNKEATSCSVTIAEAKILFTSSAVMKVVKATEILFKR